MITPPGSAGVAYSEASDGDLRSSVVARRRASSALGIPVHWASLTQVHGNEVIRVSGAGLAGSADALWTSVFDLPLAVFTADCFGVILRSPFSVGIAHVGWRGARSSTVTMLRREMEASGFGPTEAYIGPGIGPCCFEVGEDVADQFTTGLSRTTWGTTSVDLGSVIRDELTDLPVWESSKCTLHDSGFFSHRRNADSRRLASIAWL